MEGGLAKVRGRTRTLVAEQLRANDVIVESLLGTTERTIVSVKKDSDQALIF